MGQAGNDLGGGEDPSAPPDEGSLRQGVAAGPQTMQAAPDESPHPTSVIGEHLQLEMQYKGMQKAAKLMDALKGGLLDLLKLSDTITPEDVTASAKKIVAAGVPATNIAAIMAQMPFQSSEALAAWVKTNAQQVIQEDSLLHAHMDKARHMLGVSGMKVMAAGHLRGTEEAEPEVPEAEAPPEAPQPSPVSPPAPIPA